MFDTVAKETAAIYDVRFKCRAKVKPPPHILASKSSASHVVSVHMCFSPQVGDSPQLGCNAKYYIDLISKKPSLKRPSLI